MARRPDPERLAVWRQFLRVHATVTSTLERELENATGLPLAWYDVLLQLHEAGGRLRMHELAGAVLVAKSSLSRLVDRMSAAGLVERRPAEEDGRGSYACLTPAGRAALRRAAPVHLRGVQRHFAKALTDTDVVALARVLAKLG
jgi:DNA-binding MarR family transcriptional regulator